MILSTQLLDSDSLIFIHKQCLVLNKDERPIQLAFSQLPHTYRLLLEDAEIIPVNSQSQQRVFVVNLPESAQGLNTLSLRHLLARLNADDAMLFSQALQRVTWHQQHRYCGQCGSPVIAHKIEHAKYCPCCELSFYPKISPCMMCLVVRGRECLLAQHHRHRAGFFSTLAGFVEAGESIESTIKREVYEEVGITIKNIRYFSSQSWPYPHQLMLGFFADYDAGEIKMDKSEIIDARWFHANKLPNTPGEDTLSGQLISHFCKSSQ